MLCRFTIHLLNAIIYFGIVEIGHFHPLNFIKGQFCYVLVHIVDLVRLEIPT
ncbi:hypothetical protein J25TS5_31670 [Paenibacillus faecis]|nr:hypothetical protein J25TS5_31670 [Paenibacillus faecis]